MPLLAEVRSGGYPATKNVPMKNTVCALLKYKKSCEKYKNIAALIVEKCEIKKKNTYFICGKATHSCIVHINLAPHQSVITIITYIRHFWLDGCV